MITFWIKAKNAKRWRLWSLIIELRMNGKIKTKWTVKMRFKKLKTLHFSIKILHIAFEFNIYKIKYNANIPRNLTYEFSKLVIYLVQIYSSPIIWKKKMQFHVRNSIFYCEITLFQPVKYRNSSAKHLRKFYFKSFNRNFSAFLQSLANSKFWLREYLFFREKMFGANFSRFQNMLSSYFAPFLNFSLSSK